MSNYFALVEVTDTTVSEPHVILHKFGNDQVFFDRALILSAAISIVAPESEFLLLPADAIAESQELALSLSPAELLSAVQAIKSTQPYRVYNNKAHLFVSVINSESRTV